MRKCFTVCLNLPVSIEVIGEERSGEVNIVSVCNVGLPSISDINDSLTDDALQAIDKAFAESESESEA